MFLHWFSVERNSWCVFYCDGITARFICTAENEQAARLKENNLIKADQ